MSDKPVTYKKTCPWCHGTGKPQGSPSTWEMLNGGVCGKCMGTGQVEEIKWVSSNEQNASSSSTSSSDEDGCIMGIIALLIAGIIWLLAKIVQSYIDWRNSQPPDTKKEIQKVEIAVGTISTILLILTLLVSGGDEEQTRHSNYVYNVARATTTAAARATATTAARVNATTSAKLACSIGDCSINTSIAPTAARVVQQQTQVTRSNISATEEKVIANLTATSVYRAIAEGQEYRIITATPLPTSLAGSLDETSIEVPARQGSDVAVYNPTATMTLAPASPTQTSRLSILHIGGTAEIEVNNTRLNVRSGPGTDYGIVDVVSSGTSVTILDGPQNATNYTWWKVRIPNGAEGWLVEAIGTQKTLIPVQN